MLKYLLIPGSFALIACAPDTPYRYTALTPAARPIAWDGRGSPGGTVHLEGQASSTQFGIWPSEPALHATALHVTRRSLDGAILIEPVRGAQVGVRGTYSSYDWSEISTFGTMPLPNRPSLWGVGPELRLWVPFDRNDRFALGLAANALFYQVPFAEWTRQPCNPGPNCVATTVYPEGGATNVTYALTNSDAELHVVITAGLYPSVGIGDHAQYGSAFMLLGVTQGFSNDGFTDARSSDGIISTYAVGLVGGGYGFRHKWFHIDVGLYAPFGSSVVNYAPGGWLSIGFDPRIWDGESCIGPCGRD
jgi:hypothetical protein